MRSLSIELLEVMYCQHKLTDFLKKVEDSKQIENTIRIIQSHDILKNKEGILSALLTELDYRKSSVRPVIKSREELIILYRDKKLMPFLRGASEEEIKYYINLIRSEAITRVSSLGVYHLLLVALHDIDLNEYLSPKEKVDGISDEYYELSRNTSLKDLEFSIEYLEKLDVDFEKFIRKCPIMISIQTVSKLYIFFKRNGYSDDEIMEMLVLDKDKGIYTKQLLEEGKRLEVTESVLSEDEFKNFIRNSSAALFDVQDKKEKKQVKVALA